MFPRGEVGDCNVISLRRRKPQPCLGLCDPVAGVFELYSLGTSCLTLSSARFKPQKCMPSSWDQTSSLCFSSLSWHIFMDFSFNARRNKYCAQFHQAVTGEGKIPTFLASVSSDLLFIWEFWDLHLLHMGLFFLCRKMSLACQEHLSISQESSERKHKQLKEDLKEDLRTSSKKCLQQAWSLGYLEWPSAV